jgi:hypothetical protein
MASVSVERLDHGGVVASVIKDWGLSELIDARLLVHDQEEITAGEAVAGMLLNGLGCAARPLTFTPPFCANQPRDRVWHEGGRVAMVHRSSAVVPLTPPRATAALCWGAHWPCRSGSRQAARRAAPISTPPVVP